MVLKRIWGRLKSGASAISNASSNDLVDSDAPPQVIERSDHPVSRADISDNALKVLQRLNRAGYEAYLVGGGVRDLFLHLSPKDFDVATDATPEQIKKLFRNCRLVGRRFRLAHVLFGRDVIEVATFRGDHSRQNKHARRDNEGMLLRDNVYGDMRQDAFRRDFTINALYYCVKNFTVIDYTGGLDDLHKRQLRLIGDAETRYREDPVRMLRAVRLSAKLELAIEKHTERPIGKLASLLENIPAARLWDECGKMFLSGHAARTWELLCQYKLAAVMLPETDKAVNQQADYAKFIAQALESTDNRISKALPVTPAFLFAVFGWPHFVSLVEKLKQKGLSFNDAQHKAAAQAIDSIREQIAIPKRFSIVMKEIWLMQNRLELRKKRSIESIIHHPRFRAAYDFLTLRANGGDLAVTANWWTEIQQQKEAGKQKMIAALSAPKRRRSKKKYHRKPRSQERQQNQSAERH